MNVYVLFTRINYDFEGPDNVYESLAAAMEAVPGKEWEVEAEGCWIRPNAVRGYDYIFETELLRAIPKARAAQA